MERRCCSPNLVCKEMGGGDRRESVQLMLTKFVDTNNSLLKDVTMIR